MNKRFLLVACIACLSLGLGSCGSTGGGGQSGGSNPSSLNPTGALAVPSILVSGQQTQVTITSFVEGSAASTQVQLFNLSGGTSSLIGTMSDDGQGGDQVAGDHAYTITTSLTAPAAASLPLEIVASGGTASSGSIDFSVQVAQIPSYPTATDLNQAEAQLFNTAIETRTILAGPNWATQTLLHDISGNLNSMFGQFEAVRNQNAPLQSAKTMIRKSIRHQLADTLAGTSGDAFTSGLLSPAENAVSCDQLLESLGGFRGSYPNALSLNDPRLQQFAQELTTICSTASTCQGAFTQSDFLGDNIAAAEWANEYIVTGQSLPTPISGCSGGVSQSLAGVAVKAELGQFTDLAGQGITSLADAGQIVTQVVGQAVNYLIGWIVDSSGKQTATIAQVAPNETFGAPTGTYNLATSFGSDTANGTITNTPVYPKSITNVSPSPGVNITVAPPYVTGLTPSLGPVGTVVSIAGSGFDTTPAGNQVTFNGTAALVSGSTASSIATSVPAGATSGPVTVVTSSGSTTSSMDFTVSGSVTNPIPAISSLSPTSAAAGSTSQTLTINGSNFLNISSVNFNGSVRTPVFVSSTQLTVALIAVDLATAGTFPVSVTNPSPGGGTSNVIDFTVSAGSAGSVTLSPTSVTVPEGGAQTFTASVVGSTTGVTWTIQEGSSGGTIVNSTATSAVYVPPGTTGTFHVVATSVDNSAESSTATVTVAPAMPLVVLHSFLGPTQGDGAMPESILIQASDGNFYGTTTGITGSGTGMGTIFEVDASGNETVLHSFSGLDGAEPQAGLIQASDGYFYGTTSYGGTAGYGTAFELDPSGNLVVLHSFTAPEGVSPAASLMQASDGNFYGTAWSGGAGAGTVFKMDASGNVTLLHSFSGSDGGSPTAGLIEASDGNFYGTTSQGGTSSTCSGGCGTVFRMDALGSVTVLHSFSGSDGMSPYASLIKASDGNFYGTTSGGGAPWKGTIFKIDPTGNLTVLHSFSGPDGVSPYVSLIQASDGNFYGTTSGGGPQGLGTVFKMDASGNVTVLHYFSGSDGTEPLRGVIQGTDRNLYGTTSGGGVGFGVVFRLDLPSSTP